MEYRGFLINNPADMGSMYKIMPKGKGSVVIALRGMYTTPTFAMRAIDKYLDNKGK
jgi:hypothetical protein